MFFSQRDFWFENHQNCITFTIMKQIINNEALKNLSARVRIYSRGERILRKVSLLLTRLVIGLYIDLKFSSVSVEQSNNVMSSEVS